MNNCRPLVRIPYKAIITRSVSEGRRTLGSRNTRTCRELDALRPSLTLLVMISW